MPEEKKKREIRCDVLTVLDEAITRRGKTRIQVVSWNGHSPTLEKREYWEDQDGEEKTGKAKGFNIDDLGIIKDKLDDIEKLMEKHEDS